MKKYIISFLFFFVVAIPQIAQTKNYYCEIKGVEKELSAGLNIVFDLGTGPVYSVWSNLNNKQKLVDEKGQEIKFNSMVDAGNYISGKGWKFLQAYSSVYSGHCIVHWIFCKEANSIEEAMNGIETKDTFKKRKDGEN